MTRKFKGNTLLVLLWGTEIGRLTWDERNDRSFFYFSPDYFKLGYDISPILYPKNSPESKLAILGITNDDIYQKLPPFIADSLPDEWGNAIFNEWFEKNGYQTKDKNALTKLSFIGKTAMGALEFLPALQSGDEKEEISLLELYREAKALENKLNGLAVKDDEDITIKKLQALGTSPGGRHSKAIISQRSDGTFISGKTATDPTLKHYIIKFNAPEYSLSETEMAYRDLAELAGIEIMPSELKEIEGVKHFMTERFDRRNGQKVYMQTLAGINRCDSTYEELFRTCRMLGFNEPEMQEMFRRTAFNFLMNNTDDHRKNFSFIMNENGKWSPSPHYDVTFILETGNKPCDRHCMSLNGKHYDVTTEDLLHFADKNGIKNAQAIIDKIAVASLEFPRLAKKYGIRSDIAEIIEKRINSLRPENFKAQPIKASYSFRTKQGIYVRDVLFERSEKGNIHLLATIHNQRKKYVFTPKRKEYDEIVKAGFNDMPDELKKEFVMKFLLGRALQIG